MKLSFMKHLIYILIASCIVTSCTPPTEEVEGPPTDLVGMKNLLAEKKQAYKKLETEIKNLQSDIDKKLPDSEKTKVLVKTEALKNGSIKIKSKVQGSVLSDSYAMASSETGGRIMSMLVNEGEYVQKGQIIATVDLQTIVNQKAELEKAYELAVDVFQRQERLWNQKIGSELQYLEAKNNKERLEKSMATIQGQIAKNQVSAPISGVIEQKFLSQGELAGPGTPIVQILNTSALKVVADVPEKYLTSVRRGQKVNVFYPALDQTNAKTISMIGRTIDPANRTFKIEINTSSQGGKIKPFLLAEVDFIAESIDDVIAISPELIQEEVSGKKYVFLNKNGKASKEYIETGEANDEQIIITDGLAEGDELITEGAFFIKEGELIKTVSE